MNTKKLLLLCLMGMMYTTLMAQRHTDLLDRGLVAIPTGSTTGSTTNLVTWRRLSNEYYDVTYNLYKNGSRVASNLTTTCYADNSNATPTTQYQVAAEVKGKEQAKCTAVKPWAQYVYNLVQRCPTGFLDIPLATVYDRTGADVTANYEPNDAEMADLDGDGQLEIIVKRLNTADASTKLDASRIYSPNSTQFAVFDAYDVNWQTGAANLLWRIDCGPNMVSLNSTELNIIAYDWDEDGKAEVVLRGADNMIVYGPDGTTQLYTIGDMTVNTRNTFNTTDSQYGWTKTGAEYLIYMNGQTGELYQKMDYPLKRFESGESNLKSAWGDDYGHRACKHFFGAPFLDGRKASLFLGRGIYTRHKMIAMDLNRGSHQWTERWRWNCKNSSSPWYAQGYHNYIIADVDEDGRDEIVYGSMVIDDNGKGLSTTGYGHGDAQHAGDFDPYRKGLEFLGCLENNPVWGSNYRNATTSEVYFKHTNPPGTGKEGDDGRCLMGNFSNTYPGCQGRSVGSGIISSVADIAIPDYAGDSFIAWGDLNFRIYFDGDLCSEILNSPGIAREAKVEKPGTGRLFTSSGCNMNNDSKNNACFQGDIIGDWREEIVVRCGTNLRVYTSGIYTTYSLPTLWNDHQYRQAMVWQMMAYNQPPHLSYFLGEMEGITTAPPTLTNDGRIEVANGETITTTTDHLLMCETNDMTVSVEDGASPYILTVNTPSWVQGHDDNNNITTETYTHTLTDGAFTGKMRLVKQGDGVLELPDVTETYTGETNVWAGTLRFNGTMDSSPVWLNRHTRLETDGGTFDGGITADYGATIAVGSEGINVSTLTLNHGARLLIDIDADGMDNPMNITNLTLNTKTGDVWEQYGPKYLKPVVAFSPQGNLYSGTYLIGHVENMTGNIQNDVVLEGLDATTSPYLTYEDGDLYLIVGSGEDVSCPEATIAEAGRQRTDDGLLPIVSIDPGTFSYGGSEVMPDVTATFNDTEVELQKITLFSEDFENSTNPADYWKNNNSVAICSPDYPGSEGQCIAMISNSDKGDYTPIEADYTGVTNYAIEFDSYFNNAPKTTDFVVMSRSHWDSWHYNYGYNWKNTSTYGHNAYLLFLQRGAASTTFTVNETENTITLENSKWYHFVLNVDVANRVVNFTICPKGSTVSVATGSYNLPEGESAECDGIFVRNGRYNYAPGGAGIDNIRIYRTDRFLFPFTEPGTLAVTSSYPSCQWATVTYKVSESDIIKIGDANHDGVVNILDVTATIGHLTNHTPENFIMEAADIDGSGTVDNNDLKAFIQRFGW